MSDYTVFVRERAKVFLGGPPLVKMATGEESDDESLGGAEMHARVSGLADYLAEDEHDAIRIGRRIVARLNRRKADCRRIASRWPGRKRPGSGTELRRARRRPRGPARPGPDRPQGAVRPARGDRAGSSTGERAQRSAVRRVQAALRHLAGHRLGAAPRPPDRHPRQRPGRAVLRGGAEGDAVHPARQPGRHPAALPAQHHRLHGRQGVRAGRHHQARREDDQRRLQQHRAAPQRDHGRVLRRRQLRHERPRLRPALPLHLAQRQVGRDGPGPARRRAVDRRPRGRRGARARRTTRRATPACARWSSRWSRSSRCPTSCPGCSTTTASSTPATPAPSWPSAFSVIENAPFKGAEIGVFRRDSPTMSSLPRSAPPDNRGTPMIRLLVANRGEIARRVFATCRRLGIETVAVHSDADAGLPFVAEADRAVRLPGNAPADTYLRADLVIEAARRSGADAIHPGYGFLSENAAFARAVIDAGLIWVGPPPEAIEAMGDKVRAKELIAAKAGVPVLTAPDEPTEADLPLLVKASAGGGGRGMRVVRTLDRLEAEIAAARGRGRVGLRRRHGLRRALRRGRAPRRGAGRRRARRAPSRSAPATARSSVATRRSSRRPRRPALPATTEAAMCEAAERLARRIGYRGAGTVEFLYDPATDRFFFLEMNTRLQVEHPVTELIHGVDLVELQLAVAEGRGLRPRAAAEDRGHAIEVRLYAEDPRRTSAAERAAGHLRPAVATPSSAAGRLRGPGRRRLRERRRGLHLLRRDARQGDRVGADPRPGDPDARRGPPQRPHPRRHHQPRPARRDPHRPGLRGRRDDDDVAGVAPDRR